MCVNFVLLISGLNCSRVANETRGHVTRVQLGRSSVSDLVWLVISWRPGRPDS